MTNGDFQQYHDRSQLAGNHRVMTRELYQNDGSEIYTPVLRILATNEVKPPRLVAY